ncbi:MAG: glutamate--tRNA ligase [Bacilli bacterium]|nr:glutamate--tRNA ligase [Bacilli bacterium]
MHTYEDLANLIFPDITETVEDLEKRYPPRNLGEGSEVTRFAPSPTGFLHTGSLFTALIAYTIAHQSNGVYFFRLEDTDQKREIEGSGKELCDQLKRFGVVQNEGYFGDHEEGKYGPYVQSKRADIYKTCIKELLRRGRAYPCFCSSSDLDLLRQTQEANKVIPGYYGEYAKCRYLSVDEAYEKIKNGEKYVIRFKSEGNHLNYVRVHDLVRGDLALSENDQDIVIMKSDGLPTYHFAHLCDDHFMHTTVVTRGEEWISSLPIHLDLFNTMGFEAPKYAHLPVIMKLDNGNKRKLSKRKDNEAAVSFFLEQGYPIEGFVKYLLTIANSNFEEWLLANPREDVSKFKMTFEKMSLDGALFDLPKLQNICKEVLAYYSKEKFVSLCKEWAKEYSKELYDLIESDEEKFTKIINIEREQEKPRKDYEKYSDVLPKISFFYNSYYEKMMEEKTLEWNPFIDRNLIKEMLEEFKSSMDYSLDEQAWFASLKALGVKHGFAENFKLYKKDKDAYKGHVGDVAEMVRIALTSSKQSPNLYQVLHILGKEEVDRRIELAVSKL